MDKHKEVMMGECSFPSPFLESLEYTPPARGMWNIVHIGMLIPESHQVFICAGGCLRGVVLTAAEMGAEDRFSTVSVEEPETIDGSIEENLVNGVIDVVDRLPKKPKALLIYSSCIHEFLNVDLDRCYTLLRKKYPVVAFTDCYMTPIMRKSGITPDEKMRMQLYSLVEKGEKDDGVTFLGDVLPLSRTCGIVREVAKSGRTYREIPLTKNWDEYQELGRSSVFLYANPAARKGAEELAKRIGGNLLYLPYSFDPATIRENGRKLSTLLSVKEEDEREWEAKIADASHLAKGFSVAIDYTATARPLSLARLLLSHGFALKRIYLDAFGGEEKEDYEWLKEHGKGIEVIKASNPSLPFDRSREEQENVLAIGQKCAYYEHTSHFVNLIADSGHWGFEALDNLAAEIVSAVREKKDTESIVSVKGWGCKV
jgi:hypothetical protein